jgi:hypothetical protein
MIHFRVLFAFSRAGFADRGAEAAKLVRVRTAEAHKLGRSTADGRAFQVELDAAGHVLYVWFLQTGGCTVIADNCALQTSLDAAFKLLVCHKEAMIG